MVMVHWHPGMLGSIGKTKQNKIGKLNSTQILTKCEQLDENQVPKENHNCKTQNTLKKIESSEEEQTTITVLTSLTPAKHQPH